MENESGDLIDQLKAVESQMRSEALGFRAIGHYIFAFSQLEFSLRHVLAVRLGLAENLFDIVTGSYDYTMLCKVVRETYLLHHAGDERRCKAITKLLNKCATFSTDRNEIAHATWSAADGGLVARPVSRSTLKSEFKFETAGAIDAARKKVEEAMQAVFEVLGGM